MFRIAGWQFAVLVLLVFAARADAAEPAATESVHGQFVGSTPCGELIQKLLQLPADVEPPLRWTLSLDRDEQTRQPTRYRLRIEYDTKAAAGQPAKRLQTLAKEGKWTIGTGTKSNPHATVIQLDAGLAFALVGENLLHPLDADRRLMLGNGGHSYTLCRAEVAEKRIDPALSLSIPDMSYTISPLATGENVFGVFEGRTPYQGIARQLNTARHDAGFKAKWRVTLYKDPETGRPTTYKVEGTLFRRDTREGKWTIGRGSKDNPQATVFELAATGSQNAIHLLQGNDDVLFFLDADRRPLVGNADFSYTLNRRSESPARP